MSTIVNKSENILSLKVWFSKDMLYVLLGGVNNFV